MPDLTPELIIDSPEVETVRIRLDRHWYGLRRSSLNELSFPADSGLSREHLVFENGANGWTVRDAGSHNGTRVNGMRLTAPANLTHGDRIKAGHLTIRYATGGNAKGIPHGKRRLHRAGIGALDASGIRRSQGLAVEDSIH